MSHRETIFTLRILALVAALIIVATLSGCAAIGAQIQQPNVKLSNIVFLGGGLSEQVYGVTLQVDNPNGFSLPVKGLSYALKVGGQDFASGVTPNPFSIPASGSEEITVEVRTNLMDSLGHLSRLLSSKPKNLDYQMTGQVQVDLPLVGPIPFSRSGKIPLQTRAAGGQ